MKWALSLSLLHYILGVAVTEDHLQQFVAGHRKFTAELLKPILRDHDNVVIGPLYVEILLAVMHEGARGRTADQIATALSLPNSTEGRRKAVSSLLTKLDEFDEQVQLINTNMIYLDEHLQLIDDFHTTATTVYDTGIDIVDFTFEKSKSSATINDWIKDRTNNKIRDIVELSDLKDRTRVILVSAPYFSARWVSPFDRSLTKKKKFQKSLDQVVKVETMTQTGYFKYYENVDLNVKFLELPFLGGDIKMVIVLPNTLSGVAGVVANIGRLLALQPFTNEKVNVELPKFSIETRIKLIRHIWMLDIQTLFDFADLSGLAQDFKSHYVSDVFQKTIVNVTESGTEADITTDSSGFVELNRTQDHSYDSEPKIFHADHPFLYLIESNGVFLFAGRYTGP